MLARISIVLIAVVCIAACGTSHELDAGSGDARPLGPKLDAGSGDARPLGPKLDAFVRNRPPVADAGDDVETTVGTAVMLDGSGSYGPSGSPLSYAWTLASAPDGSRTSLDAGDTPMPTLRPDVTGEFLVQLVVSTPGASSARDEVRVFARPSSSGIGADVSRGVFDPAEVYLAGTLSEGACYRDAFAHPTAPHLAAVGFDCYFDAHEAMLASDGTLVYTNTFEYGVREFHCDGCPDWRPGDPYPEDPLANDTVFMTPPCDSISGNELQQFELSPDGRRMHTCDLNTPWYDETGSVLIPAVSVLDYGWDGHVLLEGEVLDVDTGARSTVTGLPAHCELLTTRAGATTGFRAALSCMTSTELWSIAHNGTATMVGVYPAPPTGYDRALIESEMAADGSLWQFAWGPGQTEDAVIVRSIGGRSEVVYTEEMTPAPAVRIHASGLVTGP